MTRVAGAQTDLNEARNTTATAHIYCEISNLWLKEIVLRITVAYLDNDGGHCCSFSPRD